MGNSHTFNIINDLMDGYEPGFRHTCAEIAALGVALTWNAQISDLVFLTLNAENELASPCYTCSRWMVDKGVKGYYYIDGRHEDNGAFPYPYFVDKGWEYCSGFPEEEWAYTGQ